jgi:hypothetical protein
MAIFIHRFIGALALDSDAFEDIEHDRRANLQSVLVVMVVCLAGGWAALGSGRAGVDAWVGGAIVALGAWLMWAGFIASIGTMTIPEPETRSELPELLRVLGFATAPGVFIALAALTTAAPLVTAMVGCWIMCASVIAVRQALDYRHFARAIAVCVLGAILTAGLLALINIVLATTVQ